jgi:MFS family permease
MGGYLLWSLAMACLGLAPSYAALFALQLVLGMGESVAYPCYSRIFSAMPQEHRGRANAFIDAGTKLGPAAGAFLGGLVLVHYGWRMLFLVFGVGALVWLVPWYFAMPRGVSGEPRRWRAGEGKVERWLRAIHSEDAAIALRVGRIYRPLFR